MINSTVIVGDEGVILVDSGGSDEVGRHIATAVRRITDKPVTHVVNTHHHGDHYLGNVAFDGATFIELRAVPQDGSRHRSRVARAHGARYRTQAARHEADRRRSYLCRGHAHGGDDPRGARCVLGSEGIAHDR